MKYVDLANDPVLRRREHEYPDDWWQCRFDTEREARSWKKEMLAQPDYIGGQESKDWRYGYIYTITPVTIQ
jgi:hypothetical protein